MSRVRTTGLEPVGEAAVTAMPPEWHPGVYASSAVFAKAPKGGQKRAITPSYQPRFRS